jgi:hypothetical protein
LYEEKGWNYEGEEENDEDAWLIIVSNL